MHVTSVFGKTYTNKYSVLQCVAVCCSVLQCVAVCFWQDFYKQVLLAMFCENTPILYNGNVYVH